MMPTKHTAIVAAFVAVIAMGVALPDSTSAYTPIEEFFMDYEYITPRDAKYRVSEQNKVSAQRREQEQEVIFSLQQPPKGDERALARTREDDEFYANEASPTDIINALTQLIGTMQNQPSTLESRRDQRLLERLTLHAGAPLDDCRYTGGCAVGVEERPLAHTGPGTVMGMIGLLAAGAWTVRRSHRSKSAVVGSIA